jgi:hypothetical protein
LQTLRICCWKPKYAAIAQLVEQPPCKRQVVGSTPTGSPKNYSKSPLETVGIFVKLLSKGTEMNKYEESGLYKTGAKLVILGDAMMNEKTTVKELISIAQSVGLTLEFRISKREEDNYGPPQG